VKAFASVPLLEICSPKQWKTLSISQLATEGYPVYGANGVVGFYDEYTHEHPTLMITCRGATCGTINLSLEKSYIGGNAMALDGIDTRRVHLAYLRHCLEHRGFDDAITGAAQPQITRQSLARVSILLPPLDEQRRIAAILDKADALRQKRKRAIALLDSLTQAVFLEMFGDPISNIRGFRTALLEKLVSPTRKITYGILMPGDDQENGIPYVRVTDIQGGNILVDQLRRTSVAISNDYRRSALKAGDLLISIRGHVGRMAIAPQECEGANITQDTARLALIGADPVYVMNALATPGAQHWMHQRTKGAAVRGINLGDLKRFPIPLPSAELQTRFAREAASIACLLVKSI